MNLESTSIASMESNNSSTATSQNEILSQAYTLRESVEIAMKNYFSQLEEQQPVDLYNLVLAEIEAPLMESVMKFTRGNQTKASEVLGLNRGTLRKKLKTYGLN